MSAFAWRLETFLMAGYACHSLSSWKSAILCSAMHIRMVAQQALALITRAQGLLQTACRTLGADDKISMSDMQS